MSVYFFEYIKHLIPSNAPDLNIAGDCSISLKFRTNFDHVTLDVPRIFKVNRSKVKVTAWHNVPA